MKENFPEVAVISLLSVVRVKVLANKEIIKQ